MTMTHWKGVLAGVVLWLVWVCPVGALPHVSLQGNGKPTTDLVDEPEVDIDSEVYRLGPGDVFEVVVYGEDDLTRLVTVQHGGEVSFPLIGEIQVAGLTLKEVRQQIEELLGKDFLVDPQVNVKVKEYLSQWVTVVGEIARPGRYYLTGPETLLDLLTEAGGFTSKASGELVITRLSGVFDDGTTIRRVWLSRDMAAEQQKSTLALNLSSGDLITVPAQDSVYVNGEVKSPGSYPLTSGLTVLRAISLAGGLSKFGSKGGVEILRNRGGGEPERIDVDLGDIEKGKKPDIPLAPGDVVKVGKRVF
jgi:polysaccharide export outer membrane protein